MTDRGYLTETDLKVLADQYDGSDSARRTAETRIRQRTRNALRDLTLVAKSDQVDIDPEVWYQQLPTLIETLMVPADGLTPLKDYDGTPSEYREEYLLQHALHERLEHLTREYGDILHDQGQVPLIPQQEAENLLEDIGEAPETDASTPPD